MNKKIKYYLDQHTFWAATLGLLFFAFLTASLMNFTWGELPLGITVDKIAHQDIRADKDYNIVDEEATEESRREALDSVLPVFDWNEGLGREKIVENRDVLTPWKEKGIIIRQIRHASQPRFVVKDLSTILTVDEARTRVPRGVQREDINATIFFNEAETQVSRMQALAGVEPVIIHVQAGESIVRNGDPYTSRDMKVIEGMRKEKSRFFGRTRLIGTFFFIILLLGVFLFVFQRIGKRMPVDVNDLVFQGVLLLMLIVLQRSMIFISGAVRGLFPFDVPLFTFYGLVPIAAGAMMVRLVLPLSMAVLFAPVSAVLAGMLLQGSWNYTLYYLIGSVMGIQLMSNVHNRSQILKVGLELGLLNVVTLLALDLVNVTSLGGGMNTEDIGIKLFLAFLGGPLSSVMVLILMPVFETIFNYVTPIKLLEYGSLNHPILREMIVRAPGTYHHSHMVGTLSESACEAIGADSLFARVASYFHDIGKLRKANYFIENMTSGEDRHSILSPSMSALIISAHVKDGIELASEYKLPQKIIDIIPQHQGTKLISYFFNKAKESENPEMHVVDEREFRYPGPKPQTREAGVILLADTVEAATRALKDRSPARLEEVVRNMINKNFIDGQLDECELTLKDLHSIAESFVRILMGVYHQRIEYPPDEAERAARERPTNLPIGQQAIGQQNADKYLQSKPIREGSLHEVTKITPKDIRRIGPDRS